MEKIRLIIFSIFGFIGALFLVIGAIFLNKKQTRKLTYLLEEFEEQLLEWKGSREPISIEDKMLYQEYGLTQTIYDKGTNKDLSVECCLCGEVTPRGKYFKRNDTLADTHRPYNFICKNCYNSLPFDERELQFEVLFDKNRNLEEVEGA